MSEARADARPSQLRRAPVSDEVEPRVATQAGVDVRIAMVLEVLGGRTIENVALEWDVESSMLHRWVRDFLVAGTAVVTHRPDPDEARQRDRFLAAFAHEMRSPMTVAQGWAMELVEGEVPQDQITDAVQHLSDALTRLSEHILDVELAASVSLGRLRVDLAAVDLVSLCHNLPGNPDVRRGGDLVVHASADLLERILRDLWACAHREPAPASVGIEVVESGSWTEIRVVREGTPISPMVIQALFDPFGSNDDATGVTMGLYMARALTVAHGGFLGAEGDDQTTVLYTRLPREPSVASGVIRLRSDQQQGGNP